MDLIATPSTITFFVQLILAMVLGLLLGAERSMAGKTAGMRTYALVSVGSCLFITISVIVTAQYAGLMNFDPLRVTAGIVTGIGFLGAGLIIVHDKQAKGLTTAAGLWMSAGIGVAVGFGLYAIAVFTTLLTLFVFTLMWFVEDRLKAFPKFRRNIVTVEETAQAETVSEDIPGSEN